jgi:AraC-like DNA-binding protein
MTVNEYVRLRRLDMAKTALMVEGLSIGEEAYIAGYNHSSNFIAAFKRQFAMTPSELLRSHRG